MSEASALERRYRRLLAAYPREHRRVHGEEMIGVLLTTARPGQRWPRLADAADLVTGALRIWARALSRPNDPALPDAMAMLSVIAPILLLAYGLAKTDLIGIAIRAVNGHPVDPFWLAYPSVWPVIFGPALMTGFALLGMRRSTAATALAVTVAAQYSDLSASVTYFASAGLVLLSCLGPLAAVGALLSPGPRRGRELLRWWGVAAIAVVAIVLAELSKGPEFDIPLMRGRTPWLVVAAALAVAAGVCLTSRIGRRLLAALAIPGVAYASYLAGPLGRGLWPAGPPGMAVMLPPVGMAACLIVVMAVRGRRRRRTRPTSPQKSG